MTIAVRDEGEIKVEREVRFAVVIYGGVSLTVYINGIVQEMLHMVRSTAKMASTGQYIPFNDLSPVEQVYRKLATLVGEPALSAAETGTQGSASGRRVRNRPGKVGLLTNQADKTASAVRTRFIVDILSGTSAGGINAIYLAKALANGLTIDSLARMWITDADLDQLLNDKKVKPKSLRQTPPQSLLSSRWMYLKLLDALHAMEETGTGPLVDDLDLYCTTTDLRGMPIKIALTDESVKEQRYRNFYHFKRRTYVQAATETDHDLSPDMDPFLAFAARCTSSFPVAFEPMQLSDIPDIAGTRAEFRNYFGGNQGKKARALFGDEIATLRGADKFAEICRAYDSEAGQGQISFANRPFGDGGYLDNKPFTYAIDTVKKRHATLPVDRKLIYIEPGPESFDERAKAEREIDGKDNRPTAIENALDALVTLPRYENIRQDIESVIEWNSNIGRLHRVLDHIDEEIISRPDLTLNDLKGGLGYDTYWRLRLSGAADQLGNRLAEGMSVEPSSAEGQALRSIAGTWRERMFFKIKPLQDATIRASQQRFLDLFDFDYCERAIRFLRSGLQRRGVDPDGKAMEELAKVTADFMSLATQKLQLDLTDWDGYPYAYVCWEQYLTFIVDPKAAARALGVTLPGERPVLNGQHAPPAHKVVDLLSTTDAGRDRRIEWLFKDPTSTNILDLSDLGVHPAPAKVAFSKIVDQVAKVVIALYSDSRLAYVDSDPPPLNPRDGKTQLQSYFDRLLPLFAKLDSHLTASKDVWKPQRDEPAITDAKPQSAVRSALDVFCLQDLQMYPIVFGTALGEFETVNIYRISPQDTRPIAGTAPPGCDANASPPLRGASLGAFGAFLDENWRLGDMLRGRLDGAERLITAILPDSDEDTLRVREELIREAQVAIAQEWKIFEASLNLKQTPSKKSRAPIFSRKVKKATPIREAQVKPT